MKNKIHILDRPWMVALIVSITYITLFSYILYEQHKIHQEEIESLKQPVKVKINANYIYSNYDENIIEISGNTDLLIFEMSVDSMFLDGTGYLISTNIELDTIETIDTCYYLDGYSDYATDSSEVTKTK